MNIHYELKYLVKKFENPKLETRSFWGSGDAEQKIIVVFRLLTVNGSIYTIKKLKKYILQRQ